MISFALSGATAACGGCSSDSDIRAGGGGHEASVASGGAGAASGIGSNSTGGTKSEGGLDGGLELDGAKWALVPNSEFSGKSCHFYQAEPGTLTFPPLKWIPCGDGCEWADPTEGYTTEPAGAVSANVEHGKAFIAFDVIVSKGDPWYTSIVRFVRLTDGITVAAIAKQRKPVGGFAPCTTSLAWNLTTITSIGSYSVSVDPESTDTAMFGFGPTTPSGNWVWAQPPRLKDSDPPARLVFGIDNGVFLVGEGGVFAALDPTSSAWTTLEIPSDSMFGGGEGDLAVWTEWQTDRIRAWAPDGKGVRTLVKGAPNKTCFVKPSPAMIVGVAQGYSAGGAPCQDIPDGQIRFWHAPRTYSEIPSVTVSPPIDSSVAVNPVGIRTWGDFAGVLAVDLPVSLGTYHLTVVTFSTGKAWRIDAEPGYVLQDASWTVDDSWLYYGETKSGASNDDKLYRIRRILLTKLAAWGKPL